MWVKRVEPDPRWADAIVSAVNDFEAAAESMAFNYLAVVEGLHATERIDYDIAGIEF
jgi:hypothetical protein